MNGILSRSGIQPNLPCRSYTFILLMQDAEAGVLTGVTISNPSRIIRASVVNEDYLKISKSLSYNTVQTTSQISAL